jgi:hypothetical protein
MSGQTPQAEIDRLRLEVKTLQMKGKEDNSERITISNYLLTRLEQLGVRVGSYLLRACI